MKVCRTGHRLEVISQSLCLGIWDLVGNNTPIFFVRDPSLVCPSLSFRLDLIDSPYSSKCLFILKNETHKRI